MLQFESEDQKKKMSQLMQSGRRHSPLLTEMSAFCSIQTFNRLDGAHPHQGGQSALLSLTIQKLISSRNTLTDAPRIMFAHMCGHPVAQSTDT